MPYYIITKAHFSGDHCHLVGLYNNYEIAQKEYNKFYDMLEKKDRESLEDLDHFLLEFHTIDDDKLNIQLYNFNCEKDEDYEDSDDEIEDNLNQ